MCEINYVGLMVCSRVDMEIVIISTMDTSPYPMHLNVLVKT